MATEIVEEAEIVGVHAPGGSWNPSCSYASIETLFTVEVDKVTNAVSIVRQLVESEHVVGRAQCWSRSFDDMDAARLCFDWLSSDPDRMILLAATATTVGSGWVDGLVLTGLASYADRLAQNEIKAAAERERIEAAEIEARRRAERISVYFEDRRGEAVLKMERGSDDEPFWQIVFEQKWERARFWDWLKWQKGRFKDFARVARESGPEELRRMLLKEMLSAEQTARRNGQTVSGQRPLRFWPGEL